MRNRRTSPVSLSTTSIVTGPTSGMVSSTSRASRSAAGAVWANALSSLSAAASCLCNRDNCSHSASRTRSDPRNSWPAWPGAPRPRAVEQAGDIRVVKGQLVTQLALDPRDAPLHGVAMPHQHPVLPEPRAWPMGFPGSCPEAETQPAPSRRFCPIFACSPRSPAASWGAAARSGRPDPRSTRTAIRSCWWLPRPCGTTRAARKSNVSIRCRRNASCDAVRPPAFPPLSPSRTR